MPGLRVADWRLDRYTAPSLNGIVDATQALGPAVPPELFTVRRVLGPLAETDDTMRWDVLRRQGQVPTLSPPHVSAPTAVLRLDAAVVRELGWLASGGLPFPVWDRDLGELRFNRVLLKRVVTGKASNVVAILDAFQAAWWPPRVDLPADVRKLKSTRVRSDWLHQTLKSLNAKLDGVRFRSDGRGDGIAWEFAG